MIPYLHIFGFSIPTFGLMIWAGTMLAAWLMDRNFRRQKFTEDAITVVAITLVAGIVGAKLWHVLDSPDEFHLHGWKVLWDTGGFAWFGGMTFGIATLLIQGWRSKIGALHMLDLAAPSAAIGYGVGRIGCLLSGDGCYGVPTSLPWGMSFPNGIEPVFVHVHPTPLYEFLVSLLIAGWLWWRGGKSYSTGEIVGQYLVLSGVARFLVEFVRRNPPVLWGLSNAQLASFGSVVLGLLLVVYARRSKKPSQEVAS
jgi:phosphatidylglycerol:prolipoprotein diacylglycerol transferase